MVALDRMTPGHLLFAPLQGVTDPVVRDMITALGGVDACVSVFARVSNQALPVEALVRTSPEIRNGGKTRAGVPVHLQLLGSDPDLLARTARRGAEAGATTIDLNFGCPMGRVNRHDGGAALLRSPERLTRIVAAVRAAVPSPVAVSAKVRIGWSHGSEAPVIARAVEDGGASWMTVHGRTRDQLYEGTADWEAIGRAREAVRIPIVANGDIRGPAELARCREVTGCESFMIGRGALARPEVFQVLAGIRATWWPPRKRLELLADYGSRCLSAGYPEPSVVGRVKGWWRYMAEADPFVDRAFVSAKCQTTWDLLHQAVLRAADAETER